MRQFFKMDFCPKRSIFLNSKDFIFFLKENSKDSLLAQKIKYSKVSNRRRVFVFLPTLRTSGKKRTAKFTPTVSLRTIIIGYR